MSNPFRLAIVGSLAFFAACGVASSSASRTTDEVRDLAPSIHSEPVKGIQQAVFAGGCFWGVEAVFERVKGVKDARSGYSGGEAKTANYDAVGTGKTGHAEAVIVVFDPSQVTYTQLLSVFFSVGHDPTDVDRQGPDVGPQYRSAIFYMDNAQKQAAEAYIKAIEAAKVFDKPIATQVVPLTKFYDAEEYHQNYLDRNPTQPYIVIHDMPKIEALKAKFPELYVEKK